LNVGDDERRKDDDRMRMGDVRGVRKVSGLPSSFLTDNYRS